MTLKKEDRIYVAGHRGMAGSAIVRKLMANGFENLLLPERSALDLLDSAAVQHFFDEEQPQIVILAAAKVGGIQANISAPVEFMLNNLTIQHHVISQSYLHGVRQLVFLGSSCIYPRDCPQPMKETDLLTGKLEPTNEGYALAKITGLKLLEYYFRQYGFRSISLIPCNLYGTNDSYDPAHAHVLSALIRKFVDAKNCNADEVTIWGTGLARREFMHVDDLASAVLHYMLHFDHAGPVNIGWGTDLAIHELVDMIKTQLGFKGRVLWDKSRPDGMMRKCMDVSHMRNAGFLPEITLEEGITRTVMEYKNLLFE